MRPEPDIPRYRGDDRLYASLAMVWKVSATLGTAPTITVRGHAASVRGGVIIETVHRSRSCAVANEIAECAVITSSVDPRVMNVIGHIRPAFSPRAVMVSKCQVRKTQSEAQDYGCFGCRTHS